MSLLRFTIDVAIPESETGTRILDTDGQGGIVLPNEVVQLIRKVRPDLKALATYAKKINEGQPNEEITVKARFHISHHDDPLHLTPDEPEQEI